MTKPTHRHRPTGALVFPVGYAEKELELLPADFWPQAEIEDELARIRARRDKELAASDTMMLSDRRLSDDLLAQWVDYRQQLRDVTEAAAMWPIKPKEK